MNKEDLLKMGISRTVFSHFYPETRKVIAHVLMETASDQSEYEQAFTGSQDPLHINFLRKYQNWSQDIVKADWSQYPFSYPSNGSSEAIREQIAYLKAKGVNEICTFDGEYEGYAAIASGMDMLITTFEQTADVKEFSFGENCAFFLSQPSSIDGNVWPDYDRFMQNMLSFHPNVPVYVDLCYVGCVAKEFEVDVTYDNIDGVFFSLSKVFGVYYHRIGGVFLKQANPLMYGNMWFKNLLSMKIGSRLMDAYSVYDLPQKYAEEQACAINKINTQTGLALQPADVVLLANTQRSNLPNELNEALVRHPDHKHARVCLTPTVEAKTLGHYLSQEEKAYAQ